MPLKILLADDHVIVRQGLKALLERAHFDVVAEASDGHEAIRLARQHHPDVAILDLTMPLLNGLDAAREIRQRCPKTKTIMLTMHTAERYVLEGFRAGVKGYVLKSHSAVDLIQAIYEIGRGMVYLSPGISRTIVDAYAANTDPSLEPLSPREREVLQLVAEGKTTKESAQVLGISVKTAESHRTNIMRKLDVHQTAGLVRYAIRQGVIEA